jgi:hypothetical protein
VNAPQKGCQFCGTPTTAPIHGCVPCQKYNRVKFFAERPWLKPSTI